MAKKGTTKKAVKRKAATRKAPKRKSAPRRPAKRKQPRTPTRRPAQRKTPVTAPSAGATRTVSIGCSGSDCVPDQDPLTLTPGETFQICAPSNKVKIHFTARPSPLDPPTDPLTISQGTCINVTVADDASGSYRYHVTCSSPGCGNLSADPEMIVEG